jgi:membrane protease YdiL (CAAX protease family)
MTPEQMVRAAVPVLLGIAASFLLDRMCAARGLYPPGFRASWRRLAAGAVVAGVLAVGIFAPLGGIGLSLEPDLSKITTPGLFALHILMIGAMGLWFLLGWAGVAVPQPRPLPAPALPVGLEGGLDDNRDDRDDFDVAAEPPPPPVRTSLGRQFAAQFGYHAPDIPREIGLGLVLGLAAWVAVLLALMAFAGILWAVGGEDAVPQQPPSVVPFIAGLPILIRILISLSAGVVEESFFRGFLQPRIGILLSTAFFALAHLSYGQPFLLIGITLLSLIYAFLVKWRQNLWPSIAAHTLFDGVQLLVVVPGALRLLQGAGVKTAAFLMGLV